MDEEKLSEMTLASIMAIKSENEIEIASVHLLVSMEILRLLFERKNNG